MAINKKFAAIGAAGIVALGGAGLYAGSLATSASGTLGSGTQGIQASCVVGTVNVAPGTITWDTTDERYEYSTLVLTADFTGCVGGDATANVYNKSGGAIGAVADGDSFASGTFTPLASPANDSSITVTLSSGVDAGLVSADTGYGVLIET